MSKVSVLKSGKTLTKADIAMKVYEKIGFSKKEAAELVELLFGMMKDTLNAGEKLKISGFGNFEVRDKRERRGRNPQTGEAMMITPRRVVTFHPSQILKKKVNRTPLTESEMQEDAGGFGTETPI